MARWAEKRAQQRAELEVGWEDIVVLNIDREGNLIEVETVPKGMPERVKLRDAATEYWRKLLARHYAEPEHVHPLVSARLVTNTPFSLMVNLKDAPQ